VNLSQLNYLPPMPFQFCVLAGIAGVAIELNFKWDRPPCSRCVPRTVLSCPFYGVAASGQSRAGRFYDDLVSRTATSPWWRPVLQVARSDLNASRCKGLRNNPPLRRALLMGVVGKSFQRGFGESDG
jgi:hypothetical protein